ncbi:hypothetical protein BDZ94DRAFT_1267872, partial [Collybia nuda]
MAFTLIWDRQNLWPTLAFLMFPHILLPNSTLQMFNYNLGQPHSIRNLQRKHGRVTVLDLGFTEIRSCRQLTNLASSTKRRTIWVKAALFFIPGQPHGGEYEDFIKNDFEALEEEFCRLTSLRAFFLF